MAKVWNAKTGAEFLTLKGHTEGGVYSASFSPDGLRIVTGSWDGTAKVWDAMTGTELLTLKGHTGSVSSASFSPDGSRIVTGGEYSMFTGYTGSYDDEAKVWDAVTGAELLTLKTGGECPTPRGGFTEGSVHSVSWSRDGSRIVTGCFDKTAKVWDSRSLRETRLLVPELAPPPRSK